MEAASCHREALYRVAEGQGEATANGSLWLVGVRAGDPCMKASIHSIPRWQSLV